MTPLTDAATMAPSAPTSGGRPRRRRPARLASGAVLVALVAFALVGPLVWPDAAIR